LKKNVSCLRSEERGGKGIRPRLFPWKHTIQEFPFVQHENTKASSGSCCNSMPIGASSSKAGIRIIPTCLVNYTRHRNLSRSKRPKILSSEPTQMILNFWYLCVEELHTRSPRNFGWQRSVRVTQIFRSCHLSQLQLLHKQTDVSMSAATHSETRWYTCTSLRALSRIFVTSANVTCAPGWKMYRISPAIPLRIPCGLSLPQVANWGDFS